MSQHLNDFTLYCCALEHQHLWLLSCFFRAPSLKPVEAAKDNTESTMTMSEIGLLLHTCGQVCSLQLHRGITYYSSNKDVVKCNIFH